MKNSSVYLIIVLLAVLFASCATVEVTKNYRVGMQQETRIGMPIAEWTIGSDWWQPVDASANPVKMPHGKKAIGNQLPVTKSLIFVGYDNEKTTIRVTYREYIDGLARPAFTQDLTFNAADKVITFENFEAIVISVDPRSLTYVVTHEHSDLKDAR